MGFENRIFIIAEQFAMSSSKSHSRGAAAGGGPRLDGSISPRKGGGAAQAEHPEEISPICRDGMSEDHRTAAVLANGFIHVFNTVNLMMQSESLTPVQAATILRAQIARILERGDPAKKYKEPKVFAPLAMKILSQLQTLGKLHQFTHEELQYFVLMCAPNPDVFETFRDSFLTPLADLDSNSRTFFLLFWIAVMTMTNIPQNKENLNKFYEWFNATISGQATPRISPELAAIFGEMQTKVNTAYEAIDDEPNDDPTARRQARQKLGLPPSEDDDDDGASANSGFSAASASSTTSAGGTRRDPLWRFRAAIMCLKAVFEQLCLQSGKHAFFESISPKQLDELVRGLMKKMTCRSSGPRSHNAFGRKIREILLNLINKHRANFDLCITRTTTSIIVATGSVQAGLDWHIHASSVDLSKMQNNCICSALIMFDLGINGSLQNTANVKPILDAAFGSGQIKLPEGKFAKLAQSAAERASKDLTFALAGQWRSVREDCETPSQPEEHVRGEVARRGRGNAQRGRGNARRGRGGARGGGANVGDRVGDHETEDETKDETKEQLSSELTTANIAALQARIRGLEAQVSAQKRK
jgi:hypothetical protein